MLNFNVDPYYDDFDPNKNYHRILFKPGRAVQARELTQSQTILQDQITKFANHIFKQNTPVTGGQVTVNNNSIYIKLNSTYNDNDVVAADFLNQIITDSTGTIFAKVVAIEEATSADPPTLYVTYLSGRQFSASDVIITSSTSVSAEIAPSNFTGFATTASIAEGVFYIINGYTFSDIQNEDGTYSKYSIGNFVSVQPQTIVVQKYSNTPTKRVGLDISEYISDYISDSSLLDPAVGATNYQAPGADRYTIKLSLTTKEITDSNDSNFIELVRITNGIVQRLVNGTVYATIDDYFAKRTYDTNGDFIVSDFKLSPKANTSNSSTYQVQVGAGVAYVKGYRVESYLDTTLETSRARTTETLNNARITTDYGNYVYVNNIDGVFDVTKVISVDFHAINVNSAIVTTNTTTYNSTKVGSALLRGLEFENASDNANTQTYIYKAYLSEIQTNTLSTNASSATVSTITLFDQNGKFTSHANAYYGSTVTIDSGPSAGDSRKVVSYNGSTKTITVSPAFSVLPTTASNLTFRFAVSDFDLMAAPTTSGYAVESSAGIDPSSKTDGIITGVSNFPTVISNPTTPELIFPVGFNYVSGLDDESYNSWKMSRNVTFSSGVGTFALTGTDLTFAGTVGTQSASDAKDNWLVVVTVAGGSFSVGDVISFTSTNTISLDANKKIATLTAGGTTFSGTILARTIINDAGTTSGALKIKNLFEANTTGVNLTGTNVGGVRVDLTEAQVYIPNANIVTPGNKQSLYISDVKRIVKIIDTGERSTAPTDAMLTNSAYDVTNNYSFDNGQNDAYYGHGSITLRTGAPKPAGALLVLLDYYQHAGGDGYFSVKSYLGAGDGGVSTSPENYSEIGTYTSKAGVTYELRDCIDFRLSAKNAQAALEFRYSTAVTGTGGALIPVDRGDFVTDYSHYLGRNDIIVLTKDNTFKLLTGKPSNVPTFPLQPDGSLLLAQLTLDPYTSYLPGEETGKLTNLSMVKVQHRRWRMQDISGLQSRVSNIEYYTSLSLLEKQAADLQVPDSNGLNRFKNGILVDNFTGFSTAFTDSEYYNAKINKRLTTMSSTEWMLNVPLVSKDMLNSYGNLSTSAQSNLSYRYHSKTGGASSVFTLPYTSANLVIQKLASSTVSLNPFAVAISEGVLNINPPMDMWVSAGKDPDVLIVLPGATLYQQGTTLNKLSASDWQGVSGTTYTSTTSSGRTVTVQTYQDQQRNTLTGYYDQVNSINGNFITDVSIQPYIRSQNLILRGKGLKINTPVSVYFDEQKVDQYLIQPNIINLTNVTGTFEEGDTIGYFTGGTFYPTGRIVTVTKTSSTGVRLYVSSDKSTTSYSATNTLQNVRFDQNGAYSGFTASGSYTSAAAQLISLSGKMQSYTGGSSTSFDGGGQYGSGVTSITLQATASATNNFYNGSTIRFTTYKQTAITTTVAGRGWIVVCDIENCWWTNEEDTTTTRYELVTETYTAVITAYNGTTKVATLSTSVNVSLGINNGSDITSLYSINGTTYLMTQAFTSAAAPRLSTDENGNFAAILQVPNSTFRTGDRVVRIDNRTTDDDPDTATTFAQAIFTASSLSTKSQSLNFGGTIQAAAKSTVFTSIEQRNNILIDQYSYTVDPIAQTFMIDKDTYPNGAFLKSIKVFFKSKPSQSSAVPVRMFIVDTLNGYPSGQVLDNSLIVKTVQEINTSDTPHYLNASTATEFEFESPVYIRSGNLYAFVLQTTSPDYVVWLATQNGEALPSTVKALPTDPTPSTITKIGGSPYIGALFESQNGITWTADQTKNLMFTVENCIFDIAAQPTIQFIVPKKIPMRKMVDVDLQYLNNANTVSAVNGIFLRKDVKYDALNITTVDFEPTDTSISYTYTPSLYSSYSSDSTKVVEPGKFATTMIDQIYLDDGKGTRVLDSNSNTSFILTASLTTTDKYVSPVISDDGLSLYVVKNVVNDMNISNTDITVTSGNVAGVTAIYTTAPAVTISAPTASDGTQAYATANLSPIGSGNYIVDKINVTSGGSGYITTPTITIAANGGGYLATASVAGETSSQGGNGLARYITKNVVLTPENDSGDLRVYYTAYKPVGSKILVYYKILNRSDTEKFDDQNWQLMTEINAGSNSFSLNRDDLREYVSAPGSGGVPDNFISYTSTSGITYNNFSQFAIKIVLATSDSTRTPVLHDLRVLALPSGA
jgi:hypothetical protein